MARSSKKTKTTGRMEYFDISKVCDDYNEKTLLEIASHFRKNSDDNFLAPLARAVTGRNIQEAFNLFYSRPFTLKDEKVRIDVELITAVYNTKLHGCVGYYHINTLIKDGKNVSNEDTFCVKSTWSSDKKEMLYEAVDNIIDDITELARTRYDKAWNHIEDTSKK